MSQKKRVHLFIKGRVQGVFFRENTRRKAEKLGVNGWIRNLDDGRVEAVFEGEEEKVKEVVKWTKRGPIIAKVVQVDIKEEKYQGEFQNFEIRY